MALSWPSLSFSIFKNNIIFRQKLEENSNFSTNIQIPHISTIENPTFHFTFFLNYRTVRVCGSNNNDSFILALSIRISIVLKLGGRDICC
ncbi:hypothetical protein L1987_54052 [Smallanthus sonchifolius]|uniref:Uncharacterized protein n=1 Tax=Smallanthus sonchifolius TaxID=185202 RepID=A0ACB9E712_9ASTR|nr:hypothetical protein L1987_54052 [Smallanthus sonchifolius]